MIHHALSIASVLGTLPAVRATPRGMRIAPVRARAQRLAHVYAGAHALPPFIAQAMALAMPLLARVIRRVGVRDWVTFRIDVGDASDPAGVVLVPITDDVAHRLATHPDAAHPDVASALAFPSQGLHKGYAWMEHGEPLCMQWLFTADDNPALRRLPVWSGMYPPLAPRAGQVEKLWTFTTARRKGVATQFAAGMLRVAHARGLRTLRTHISAANKAALHWAQRTGWVRNGTIARYTFDLPGLRSIAVCVHRHPERRVAPASGRQSSRRATAGSTRGARHRDAGAVTGDW